MTIETFRTTFDDAAVGQVRGDLLNKIGRALNGVSGVDRVTGLSTIAGSLYQQCGPLTARWTDQLQVRNGSGSARSRFEILQVAGLLSWETEIIPLNIALDGETPSLPLTMFAVLFQDARVGDVVECQIDGICPALVNVTNTGHRRARATAGSHVLQSDMVGPCEILWKPAGLTGQQTCIVHVGPPDSIHMIAKSPSGGIPARVGNTVGTALCPLWYLNDSDVLTAYVDESAVQVTVPVKNLYATPVAGNSWLAVTQEVLSWKILEVLGNGVLVELCAQENATRNVPYGCLLGTWNSYEDGWCYDGALAVTAIDHRIGPPLAETGWKGLYEAMPSTAYGTIYVCVSLDCELPPEGCNTCGAPSQSPSVSPSLSPSISPSLSPSVSPSLSLSASPSESPSQSPSGGP